MLASRWMLAIACLLGGYMKHFSLFQISLGTLLLAPAFGQILFDICVYLVDLIPHSVE